MTQSWAMHASSGPLQIIIGIHSPLPLLHSPSYSLHSLLSLQFTPSLCRSLHSPSPSVFPYLSVILSTLPLCLLFFPLPLSVCYCLHSPSLCLCSLLPSFSPLPNRFRCNFIILGVNEPLQCSGMLKKLKETEVLV